jgi:hypothetical protein
VIRRAFEDHHHGCDEVRGYVAEAAQLVDELGIPDDLRVAAFTQAVTLLASKQITYEQIEPGVPMLGNRRIG